MIISSTNSSSNWLDRLRSIKGLPAADNNLGIDHYLKNPQPPDSALPSEDRAASSRELKRNVEPEEDDGGDMRTRLQNTLCELFSMKSESSSGVGRKKKVPRKQVNPRSVEVEKLGNCGVGFAEAGAGAGAGAGSMIVENEGVAKLVESGEEEEEEEGFEGYSRSDVTVIDTSCEVWKSDKWVFRKDDVWKAKEKRGKCRSLLKKKKRKGKAGDGDDGGAVKKKAKISKMEVRELQKDSNYNHQDGRRKEVAEDSRDYFSHVPRKRIHFSRTPKKFKSMTTPVVLIKGLPTKNKSEAKLSKAPAEDIPSQHQA